VRVAVLLAIYTSVLSVVAGPVLRRSAWLARSPRWGIAAWQAVTVSIVLGAAASGVALLVPAMGISANLSALLRECVLALRAQYRGGGFLAASLGATLALSVVVTAAGGVVLELWQARRGRRVHCRGLALVTTSSRQGFDERTTLHPGARAGSARHVLPVIVETDQLAAYCLPGRRGQIVLSRGAVQALDAGQLEAVLAHERAHLAGRHHLLLAVSSGLGRAFWFVPVFGQARDATAVLVEMLADDRASRIASPLTVAAALLALASPGPSRQTGLGHLPAASRALGASNTATGTRVRRLMDMPAPLRPVRRAAAAAGFSALLLAPLVLLLAPALALANTSYCPA
jgi:Zn-dependent protease with chaperone function